MTDDAKKFINEILDYFQNEDRDPGGDWAFPDDFSSLCLDYRDRFETRFWIDIERDGTISLLWAPRGGKAKSVAFAASHTERVSLTDVVSEPQKTTEDKENVG